MYKEEAVQKVYHTISEVAKELHTETSTLRFYQSVFPWIDPKRSNSGHRKYSRKDINQLVQVKGLIDFGMTIEGIQKAKEIGYLDNLLDFKLILVEKYGAQVQKEIKK